MTSQTCKIAYGTSGFRCEANLLLNKTGYSVATRVGFFAGYRARYFKDRL
jgi:hypothetical protein